MRDLAKKNAAQARYALTPQGIATRKRYYSTEKGKESYRRYRRTFAGMLMLKLVREKPEDKLRRRLYMQTYLRNGT